MNEKNGFKHNTTGIDYNQRSGEDRRQKDIPVSDSKRTGNDRRALLQGKSKIFETYGRIPLFKNLSNDQLLKVLRICSKIQCSSMTYLYHKGEESINMYILIKGTINIMLRTGDVWKSLTPFSSVGEMGFFNNTPRCTDVISDTECILLQLNKSEVLRLFEKDRELHVKILQNIVGELTKKILSDHDEIEELQYRINAIDKI